MFDVAMIEIQAGPVVGFGSPLGAKYESWSAPAVGAGSELRAGRKARFGIAAWYQLNTYRSGSSDDTLYYLSHPYPRAHVPQLVVYWGHAFTLRDGSEHGPRVGLGSLLAIADKRTDPNPSGNRDVYPGIFAQAGYHGCYAVPGTQLSLVGEATFILGLNRSNRLAFVDWSTQARLTAGAQWRF